MKISLTSMCISFNAPLILTGKGTCYAIKAATLHAFYHRLLLENPYPLSDIPGWGRGTSFKLISKLSVNGKIILTTCKSDRDRSRLGSSSSSEPMRNSGVFPDSTFARSLPRETARCVHLPQSSSHLITDNLT